MPEMSPTPNQQQFPTNFLFLFLAVLAIVGAVLAYILFKGGQLPFLSSPATVIQLQKEDVGAKPVDTGRIETCVAQKGLDPLVGEAKEVVPGIFEIDYRGKIAAITPAEDKTTIKLTSVDGKQSYDFLVDNTEIIYGKVEGKVQDLKFLDELLIATNCKAGEKGNLKISRIYKVGT